MKIQTKYHGEIEIVPENIIYFEQGIPSFIEEKQFHILPFSEESSFFIMQSVQTPSLGFVIINPFEFFSGYSAKLSDQVVEELSIESPENVVMYVILTLQDPFEKTTANLQAPLVINTRNKKGKQVILSESGYQTKHLLMTQLSSVGKED